MIGELRGWKGAMLVFLAFFTLFLYTCPPSLAPYRDAGEMGLSASTLGVSHPPGYPLYVLAARAANLIPLATAAFRLNVFSAAMGAAALALFYLLLLGETGAAPAAFAVLALGLNPTFWTVSIVSEMYSMNLALMMLLLLLAVRREGWRVPAFYLLAFLYGLSLGNRTDLLLLAPAFLWLLLAAKAPPRAWLRAAGFFLLGLSVYGYLPLRSAQEPWLDWNHPEKLANFWGTITRKTHGGTLDLLSKNYPAGAMFGANLKENLLHAAGFLGWPGVAAAALGIWAHFQSRRAVWPAFLLAYIFAGPVFLFLANMPPNPHALAIVEPHYLMSDVILAVWMAWGLRRLLDASAGKLPLRFALLALFLLQAGASLWAHESKVNHRENYFIYDFCRNIFRTAPPDSVLIAKKDVQLFSLWHYHLVENRRPDLTVIAQGLSASPWYQESWGRRNPEVVIAPVKTEEELLRFVRQNRLVYATPDAELPDKFPYFVPEGLLWRLTPMRAAERPFWPWPFYVARGHFVHEEQPNFFNSDVIEMYVQAHYRAATLLWKEDKLEEAVREFKLAWAQKRAFPYSPYFLGFLYFQKKGDLSQAERMYRRATELFDYSLDLARDYRALPDVRRSYAAAAADAYVALGAVLERAGKREEAEKAYLSALEREPNLPQAHFNMAVLYWEKDWRRVAGELEAALRLNPSDARTQQFLAIARSHL
ncbi:MAG: DUF2723 domain-containing protein [Elusimicrobia bacterium]|nr:DUF2723 domain-containing protein [Elusimicrobiota bacterium]